MSGLRGVVALGWIGAALFASRGAFAMGALEALARDAAAGLGAVPQAAIVVAAPLVSDEPAPKGDEIATRIAALTAGKIGGAARAHAQTAQLGVARAIAGKGGALVFVQVAIAKGDVRATVDVYPAMKNGWDRIRNPAPAPTAHAFASAKIDAEVRASLAPILLEQASVHKATQSEGDVLAVACGDFGDGVELALVSRTRVAVGRIRAGAFEVEHAAAWSALSARAPAPLREPIGSATFSGGALFVATTDRQGVSVDRDLAVRSRLTGVPIAAGDGVACVAPDAGASALDGPAVSCTARGDAAENVALPVERFDAVASSTLVSRDGREQPLSAAREPSGKLHVRLGDTSRVLDGAGAQVAVGDLDEDGVAEIVTTADGGDDFVRISSWGASDLKVRRQIAAPGGVSALAVCPAEERGVPALIAVVGGEIWIVR
jgi:hypothetical protein